jgi:hypothetical protein
MAEEIRAKADGFSSAPADQTMAQVAMCYDKMADDLENDWRTPAIATDWSSVSNRFCR